MSLDTAHTDNMSRSPGGGAAPNENLNNSAKSAAADVVDAPNIVPLLPAEMDRLKSVVWGGELKEEVFDRWSQGFHFSDDEPAALIQEGGGPCAVITPVQGFIIKHLLSRSSEESIGQGTWRHCPSIDPYSLLIAALTEMLQLVASPGRPVRLVHVVSTDETDEKTDDDDDVAVNQRRGVKRDEDVTSGSQESRSDVEVTTTSSGVPTPSGVVVASPTNAATTTTSRPSSSSSPPKKLRLSHDEFHATLAVAECVTRRQLEDFLRHLQTTHRALSRRFAVLTFLYSSLLTKGLDEALTEFEDPSEPLIDGMFGHGSQSLLNLCITGNAVSNVFDDEKDLGGYKLQGVKKRAPLGFLSYLEHLRYCDVGWFLKNPVSPIWVLGSETHFTLAFSPEKRLIVEESPVVNGRRCFKKLDPEGNGFITTGLLKDLLASADLVSEPPEYVTLMRDKMDPEGLGIIVLSAFLREFYGSADFDAVTDIPKKFALYHYNGLRKSGDPRLTFSEATARIDEPSVVVTDATPIKLCLQTKWPTLEVDWNNGNVPSLN